MSGDTEPALLSVEHLTVEFLSRSGWLTAVDDVTFAVRPGETVGIVGESGSGKSVTSMAVMGLIPRPPGRIASGSAWFGGRDLISTSQRELENIRGRHVAMIFQEPMTSLNPTYTIGEQIAETVRRHLRCSRREAANRAIEVLSQVQIPNAAKRARSYPHEFSGGMRQRVMIAMALCCQPSMLIADEPTTALDVTVQSQVLNLLKDLQAETGMAILFITHDLGVVADICDRVAVMYAGQLVETAPATDLFRSPRHPYTDGLLKSMPSTAESDDLYAISGQPPVIGAFPDGCRFHPRCPHAEAACAANPSALRDLGPDASTRCRRADELVLGKVPS